MPNTPLAPRAGSAASRNRRAGILAATRDLVGLRGFRDTQMTAVAEKAGVALGTLYRYFPSKSELMVEVVALVAQREVDVAAVQAGAGGTAIDRVAATAWIFASRALKGRRLAHALVAEPVEPEIEAARLVFRAKLARIFETIIDDGVGSRELPDQNAAASAACIVGSLFDGLVGPLAFDPHDAESARRDHAVAVVTFCMRAVSGQALAFKPGRSPPKRRGAATA